MKICIIGAGSPYTPELIERLSEMQAVLPISEIALMDINESRLDIMHGFCLRYAVHLGFEVKITKTMDQQRAISGADFVNTQIRVGGNEARVRDERIPLSMGLIGQETTGAGGFIKALRTIPVMLDIAKDVEKLTSGAWIINYTNPTGIVAEAVMKHSKAKIAGLCAGGLFPQHWVAAVVEGIIPGDVRYDFAGLNHMNFAYNITVKGKPLTEEAFALAASQVGSVEKDLILKLDALPSPYLQYYFHTAKRTKELMEVPKTRGEEVIALEKELFRDFADTSIHTKPESLKKRGGGGYSDVACMVMDALYNNRDTWAVVNTANQGIFPFLPDDAVIEVPSLVNRAGITPVAQGKPPHTVVGLVGAVKNYESLTVQAAVTGCRDTALLALLAHPLVGDYDVAKPLLDKLLEANKAFLPQFWSDVL